MGDGMICATTSKTQVAQGSAITPQTGCATTTTPKGEVVVVAQRDPVQFWGGAIWRENFQ